jgi:transcriptional regulator with XRE-family HTH domain
MMNERVDPLAVFHRRLQEAVQRSGLSKSDFAELAGIDRTTLSQLLSPSNRRLPRFDTIVAIAATHQVSTDWLVGLSNAGPVEAEMMAHTSFTAPGPSESDERLLEWMEEAADYKVRYVPATLPDLLKTDAVIRHERSGGAGPDPTQTMETTAARLTWARHPDSEMECCSSMQGVTAFARGEGIFRRLGVATRREQLDRMIELTSELYPMFRWFMFDGLQRYAAPVTIFGHRRAALYLGQMYLVLTSAEHVRTLSRHFDGLIREATVQPHQIPTHLSRLRRELDR